MIFRKKIERRCAYCEKAIFIDDENMFCHKAGVVSNMHKCGGFVYDPVKRIPPPPATSIPAPDADDMKL